MRVTLYLAVVALFTVTTGITYTVLVLFATSVGVSAGEYGLVTALGLGANAISRPLSGRLSDRSGRRGFLVIGLALLILAQVVYAVTPHAHAIVVLGIASVLVGLGAGIFWPVLNATVVEALPKRQRERPLGLVTATQSVSVAVGAAIGGTIGTLFGYRWTFVLAAIVLGAALLLASYLGRRQSPAPPRAYTMPKGRLTMTVLGPASSFFLLSAAISATVTFLPLYAHVVFRSSAQAIGFVFFLVLLARAAGSVIVGVIAERRIVSDARRPHLLAAELAVVAALLLITPATGFAGLAATQVAVALILGAAMVTLVALVVDASPPTSLGSAIGSVESGGFVGSVIGSTGGGVLFQAAPHLLFPLAGAVTLIAAVTLTPVLTGQADRSPVTVAEPSSDGTDTGADAVASADIGAENAD